MRYPAHQTEMRHQKIIEEASRLFRAKGVAGASIGDVMKAANLTHGGFYAHFESKDALVCAGLEHAMNQVLAELRELASSSEHARADFLARYLSNSHRDHPEAGCPIPALAVDVAREPGVRGSFTIQVKALFAALAASLPWKRSRSKDSQVISFTCALVGALVLARATDDPALSDSILSSVHDELLKR
ncbi:TetR/AcrR family transcriptional regulator [Pseudomonas monteilii]|uniref:TetR/AcrR family transcriptional regulator n=1 Tax=Pseudomonas monteilii TaxID=76759 RepID=A0A399M985_9PSED|nr:TetR/AcrR family transcriptional regulator [Pseudomonas monteilii]RII77396.1 TetR/AcrR family transcriptional regulator [Pseudomonas monteilii]